MKRTIVVAVDAALAAAAAIAASGCAVVPPQPVHPPVTPVLEIRHSGLQADGYYQLGRFLQIQQRWDDAAVAYRKALALEPRNVDALNGIGTLHALQGRYDDAQAAFARALEFAPNHAAVINNAGYAFLLAGRHADAAIAFERAAALEPDNARYAANLAQARQAADVAAAPDVALPVASAMPVASTASTALAEAPAPAVASAAMHVIDIPAAPPAAAASASGSAVPAAAPPAQAAVIATSSDAIAASPVETVHLVPAGPHMFELVRTEPPAGARLAHAAPRAQRAAPFRIELSNGNGTTGMARRLGRELDAIGMTVTRLTNHKPYGTVTTEIQYRDGHREAAAALSRRVPGQPRVTASRELRFDVDVRVVLGRDLAADVALLPVQDHYAQR